VPCRTTSRTPGAPRRRAGAGWAAPGTVGLAAALLVLSGWCPAVRAHEAGILSVGVLHWKYARSNGSASAAGNGVSVRAGTYLNRYLGFGAEVGGGGGDTLPTALGGDFKTRLQYVASLYAVGRIPISRVNLYGLAGIATIQFESKPRVLLDDDSFDGPTAGMGAEVRLVGGFFVGGEWRRYFGEDTYAFTTASLFARRQFD
jgi:Outer membrane protein beta-barrel domain